MTTSRDLQDQIPDRVADPRQIDPTFCSCCEIALRFGALLEAGTNVIICLLPNHHIIEFNRAAETLFGCKREAVMGLDYLDQFIPRTHHQAIAADIRKVLHGQPTSEFENPVRTPDGKERTLLWNVSSILDSAGQPSGIIALGHDITSHKRNERALEEHKRQLRNLAAQFVLADQRERRRVATGLHDQVGQSLAVTKLKLSLALEADLPNDTRRALIESLALIEQSIHACRTLTFQLSSMVLHELGLEAALRQLVDQLGRENPDTQFVFESSTHQKSVGEDHELMLYDITRELLFNAVKYAEAGTITLRVEQVHDRLRIIIEDNGTGFELSTLNDGLSSEGGFGYFSIRERLSYLEGELEVDSASGQGTRVVAAVPVAERLRPRNPDAAP
jgi:PAS domain S-box-containing protein